MLTKFSEFNLSNCILISSGYSDWLLSLLNQLIVKDTCACYCFQWCWSEWLWPLSNLRYHGRLWSCQSTVLHRSIRTAQWDKWLVIISAVTSTEFSFLKKKILRLSWLFSIQVYQWISVTYHKVIFVSVFFFSRNVTICKSGGQFWCWISGEYHCKNIVMCMIIICNKYDSLWQ